MYMTEVKLGHIKRPMLCQEVEGRR